MLVHDLDRKNLSSIFTYRDLNPGRNHKQFRMPHDLVRKTQLYRSLRKDPIYLLAEGTLTDSMVQRIFSNIAGREGLINVEAVLL